MAWLNRFGWLLGPKNTEAKIVIVGLVNSGKSTIMKQLKPRDVDMLRIKPSIPITGIQGEEFTYKSLTFVAFDLGINDGVLNPWDDHFKDCHAIIFVVDSADRLNIQAVRFEMEKLFDNQTMTRNCGHVPLLLLGTKCDKGAAVASLQLEQLVDLSRVPLEPRRVFSCDGLTGEGLSEALDWLARVLKPICTNGN